MAYDPNAPVTPTMGPFMPSTTSVASPDFLTSLMNIFNPQQNQNQTSQSGAAVGGAASPAGAVNLGANVGTLQAGVGGLSALGNLWTAWNATNLAKQSFNFNKTLSTDNYANQAQSYNTALADKANTRAVMENQTPAQAQDYINSNKLKTTL